MRNRLLHSLLFIILAAASASAQRAQRVWVRVEPEGEEFRVHMPEPNWRIRRELPFGGITLKPISFEVTNGGLLFSVLSFSKSEPSAPKTLDAFVAGLRTAFGERATLEFERELKLDGRAGRQFRLAGGGALGTVRVYEAERHFYVVLTYGQAGAAAPSTHFQDSFTFDRAGADRVPLGEEVGLPDRPESTPKPPGSLWPIAGGTHSFGLADASIAGQLEVHPSGVEFNRALVKPQPPYPPIAKAARAQGTVTVQIVVDEEGYVIAAKAVSGHPLLQQAAVAAARQARFTPMLVKGQPVKVTGVVAYNFVLQ